MSQVLSIVTDVLNVISAHIKGPQIYLKCYQDLLYIVDGQAKQNLDQFFIIEPMPYLHEFEQKIKGYDQLRKEILVFRNKVNVRYIIFCNNMLSLCIFRSRYL